MNYGLFCDMLFFGLRISYSEFRSNKQPQISMSSQSTITTDNDGYARTNNECLAVPSPSPVNDTVSISLIGKMFSDSGGHLIGLLTIGNIISNNETVQTNVTIVQCNGYIYKVLVGNTVLAYILSSKFNGFNEDVRLDITATAVNGFLELFVFVNLQLFAKARYDESIGLSVGNLTITPNSSTGIKQFRFVPGGFIGDEPNDFIDESVLG